MARRKKESKILTKAKTRLAGMQAINLKLDLGNGLTVQGFAQDVAGLEQLISGYNQLLSKSDEEQNIVLEKEKTMKDICERMLEGVGSKFGHDSNEYEMAGGKRKSERKRPIRKPKKTTP